MAMGRIKMPSIGMGTFGSDKYTAAVVSNAVYEAIKVGYRLFDCAEVYGNEAEIGDVFGRAISEGIIKREDLIITDKVWNNHHGEGEVITACRKSIEELGIDYIDIYFVHWPFPNYHAPHCDVDSRNPDSRPFDIAEFMGVWRQMEWLRNNGYVREIAMSNMTVPKFESVLPLCNILPYAHEMELHPSFQQAELYDYCKRHGMEIIGYCPIGSPNRPERDKTSLDVADTEIPEIIEIAKRRNCHPATVCLMWAITKGHTPIPFASRLVNIQNNFDCAKLRLTDEEMAVIASVDKDCRLVKGHVFLWGGAVDWTALWDMDGEISRG